MSELIASVVDGVVKQQPSETAPKAKRGTNELGKDAFLQLLVCQMQNQDPLEPSTDTEYISQLATFSQLESLQNLNASFDNSQAFSLVGKNVILKASDMNGKSSFLSGKVDFVNMSGKTVKLSVNGSLYDLNQLYSVIDEQYLFEQGLPSLKQTYNLTYDAKAPSPIRFEVNLGEGDTKASEVAIVLNDQILDASLYQLKDNQVLIRAEALQNLPDGIYKPSIVFNDPYYTTITDELIIRVIHADIDETEDDLMDETINEEAQGTDNLQEGQNENGVDITETNTETNQETNTETNQETNAETNQETNTETNQDE